MEWIMIGMEKWMKYAAARMCWLVTLIHPMRSMMGAAITFVPVVWTRQRATIFLRQLPMMEAVFYQMAALILRLAIMTQQISVTTALAWRLMPVETAAEMQLQDAWILTPVTTTQLLLAATALAQRLMPVATAAEMQLQDVWILTLVTMMLPTFVTMAVVLIQAVPIFQHVTTIVWQAVMTGVVSTWPAEAAIPWWHVITILRLP
jgi:hypothetical protein